MTAPAGIGIGVDFDPDYLAWRKKCRVPPIPNRYRPAP